MPRKKKQEEITNPINPSDIGQIANTLELVDIPEYMKDAYYKYISYIISGRVACNIFDGFKTIYRRILYAAKDICKDHNVKSARLDGEVIGKYSPHGSAYTSIVKSVLNGILIGKGNFGTNFGVEVEGAAASRYTEVRLNPISEILYLNKDLLPYVPYIETEMSKPEDILKEPLFLPSLLPNIYTAINNTSEFSNNMALNISIIMPRYAVLSLLNYVLKYLKEGIWDSSLLYYQYHNIIKKASSDIKSKFEEEFKIPVIEDEKGNIHLLATLPLVQMDVKLKNIPYEDSTSYKTDIVIPKKYYTSSFNKKITFNVKGYKLIDNNYENVILHDYPIRYAIQIILHTLKTFLLPRSFQDKENKLLLQINEYELLKVVRDKYVEQHIPFDQLTKEEQKVASNHSSATFMTIEKNLNKFNKDLNIIRERSKNLDKEILDLYENAYNKISTYLGKYYKDKKIQIYDVTNL